MLKIWESTESDNTVTDSDTKSAIPNFDIDLDSDTADFDIDSGTEWRGINLSVEDATLWGITLPGPG